MIVVMPLLDGTDFKHAISNEVLEMFSETRVSPCEGKISAFLTIVVQSSNSIEGKAARSAIRETWGSTVPLFVDIGTFFLIESMQTSSFAEEIEEFEDLVLTRTISSSNQVYERIMRNLQLAQQETCSDFYLFVDDRTYVNVHFLVSILLNQKSSGMIMKPGALFL